MKRAQIKELAGCIAANGAISEDGMKWILEKFSRKDLKLFLRLFRRELGDAKVIASFAGEAGVETEKKIAALFPGKKIEFRRDDDLGAGLRLEYGDFVLDYSVAGITKRILSGIRESL